MGKVQNSQVDALGIFQGDGGGWLSVVGLFVLNIYSTNTER